MGLDRAPYDHDGNLMSRVYNPSTNRAVEWRKNDPFERTLRVITREYSTTKFEWLDERGRRYPMFAAHVLELLQEATVKDGAVHGLWIVARKGVTFGIKYHGAVDEH